MSSSFLTDEDIVRLTGWRMKSRQVAWLRQQGIPMRVNATGHPIVTWQAIEGREEPAKPVRSAWQPKVA